MTETIAHKSVDAFLSYLTRDAFGDLMHPRYVFRGVADADWDLIPSAHRDPAHRSELFAEFYDEARAELDCQLQLLDMGKGEGDKEWMAYSRDRAYEAFLVNRAERNCIQWFTSLANEQGAPIPGGFLFDQGPRYGFWPEEERSAKTLHPAFALAQHHGCPTRLLDWTWHPLAAAFFAADAVRPEDTDGDLAVWAAHLEGVPLAGWQWFVIPAANVHYMHAQRGLFAFHRGADHEYVRLGRWPRLNEDVDGKFLKRITLPKRHHHELLFKLYRQWFSRAHLMPTLDSAMATLSKMNSFRGGWAPHAPIGDVRVDGAVSVVCRRCNKTIVCDGSVDPVCDCKYRWQVEHRAKAVRVSPRPNLSPKSG